MDVQANLYPHRGTRGGGGWGMEPFPMVFDMLQYFETILPLVENFDLLNKMIYILWVVALLEACDVSDNGHHLGFYPELEIWLKPWEMVSFVLFTDFAWFQPQDLLLLLKEVEKICIFTQNWLDHLLLITPYLVTIATDYH